jgi:hypothetical protein
MEKSMSEVRHANPSLPSPAMAPPPSDLRAAPHRVLTVSVPECRVRDCWYREGKVDGAGKAVL